jgi:hypothetical protein
MNQKSGAFTGAGFFLSGIMAANLMAAQEFLSWLNPPEVLQARDRPTPHLQRSARQGSARSAWDPPQP